MDQEYMGSINGPLLTMRDEAVGLAFAETMELKRATFDAYYAKLKEIRERALAPVENSA